MILKFNGFNPLSVLGFAWLRRGSSNWVNLGVLYSKLRFRLDPMINLDYAYREEL